jgi:transaldolase
MQIILDSKHMDELREIAELGIIDGATASGGMLANSDHREYQALIQEVCYRVQGPVFVEISACDAGSIAHEAAQAIQWTPFLVISIPMGVEGLKAAKLLKDSHADPEMICENCSWLGKCDTPLVEARKIASQRPLPLNITQAPSASHALLAAKAGFSYISPDRGWTGSEGRELVRIASEARAVVDNAGIDAEVLVTGIETADEMRELALSGCRALVVPYAVLAETLHPSSVDKEPRATADEWQRPELP